MESLKELRELGISLGYTDDALQVFVKDQQEVLREERVAIRQKEKEDQEFKKEMEKLENREREY